MAEITVPAAAKELGVTASALYAAIERNEVRAVIRLGKMGVTESEVERFKFVLATRTRRGPKVTTKRKGKHGRSRVQ